VLTATTAKHLLLGFPENIGFALFSLIKRFRTLIGLFSFFFFYSESCLAQTLNFFFIGVLQRQKNRKIQFIRYNLLSMNEFYD